MHSSKNRITNLCKSPKKKNVHNNLTKIFVLYTLFQSRKPCTTSSLPTKEQRATTNRNLGFKVGVDICRKKNDYK